MTKENFAVSFVTIAAIAALAAPKAAQAYRGDPNVKGPNYSAERHEQMTRAMETKDFSLWQTLMAGKGRIVETIKDKTMFEWFVDNVWTPMQKGDSETATKNRQELGLGLRDGSGAGSRGANRQGNGQGNGYRNAK